MVPAVSQCCPLWRGAASHSLLREVVRVGDFLGIKVVVISQKTWEESHIIVKSLIGTKVLLDISYE